MSIIQKLKDRAMNALAGDIEDRTPDELMGIGAELADVAGAVLREAGRLDRLNEQRGPYLATAAEASGIAQDLYTLTSRRWHTPNMAEAAGRAGAPCSPSASPRPPRERPRS